jgi:hypothetical protein
MIAAFPAQALGVDEVAHGGYSEIGVFRDWVAISFAADEAGKELCSIYAFPTESRTYFEGREVDALRGETTAMLLWEDGGVAKTEGVVSFNVGRDAVIGRDGSHVVIDAKTEVPLFGAGDRLYAAPEHDAVLLATIRAGREMVVTTNLEEGLTTRDVYSLMGVQAATRAARQRCR